MNQSRFIVRGVSGARWHLSSCDENLLTQLHRETNEPELLLRCLLNRNITARQQVSDFLSPDFNQHRHPPALLRDMHIAVERILQAIARNEKILIVTDFDVDGTTSSVILSSTIKIIGGDEKLISCYIPDRFTEGYGLSSQIIEKAAADGFKLVITADIGIKSHAEARLARQHGIDLIICDHHLPDGEDIPADAFAVLCPKGSAGTEYPNKDLAACGVALKLAEALLANHPKRDNLIQSLAKLTTIGSIADLVDVSNAENRAIISHGLKALSQPSSNAGLRALLDIAQIKPPVSTYDIGFKIGPRINAAGRIAHASTVLNLFAAKSDDEAKALAKSLDQLNSERQQIQHQLVDKIINEVEQKEGLDKVLLFSGLESDGYHRGVVGIVCSKLVEQTGRPTLACAINEDGVAHGSARSINGFHLVEALQNVSDILIKFGGHPMAAGFAVNADKIEELRFRLNRYADEFLDDKSLGRELTADAELKLSDISMPLVNSLARMQPHGIGNAEPRFLLQNVPVRSITVMKDKHLKFQLGTSTKTVEAVWWNSARHHSTLSRADQISLICRLRINEWNGRSTIQLNVDDVAIN